MHRNRTWLLDQTELRTERNRISPLGGGDGSTFSWDLTTGSIPPNLEFSRTGNATYETRTGQVVTVGTDVPRFSQDPSYPGLIIERNGSNTLCHSETFATSGGTTNWVDSSISRLATNALAPDLTATALRIQAIGANGTIRQTIASTGSGRVFSVWIRRVSGTGNIQLSLNNSTYTTLSGVTSTWKRFHISAASSHTIPSIRVVALNDTIEIWGAQVEIYQTSGVATGAATPTSYIKTTTTGASRAMDFLYGNSGPSFYAQLNNGNSVFLKFRGRPSSPSTNSGTFFYFENSSAEGWGADSGRNYYASTSNAITTGCSFNAAIFSINSGNFFPSSGSVLSDFTSVFTLSKNEAKSLTTGSGSPGTIVKGSSVTDLTPSDLVMMPLFNDSSIVIPMTLQRIEVWNYALTDSQMKDLIP